MNSLKRKLSTGLLVPLLAFAAPAPPPASGRRPCGCPPRKARTSFLDVTGKQWQAIFELTFHRMRPSSRRWMVESRVGAGLTGLVRIDVLGVGFNSAGLGNGVARAPKALRRAGLITRAAACHEVRDAGDVAFGKPVPQRGEVSGLLAEDALTSMVSGVRQKVETILAGDGFPLLIGGDCAVLSGALAACRAVHGSVGLLFVDGHEDAWPPADSTTGEAADCELGLALGFTAADVPAELAPLLRPEATALLGPRDGAELIEYGINSLRGSLWFATDRDLTGRIAASVADAIATIEMSASHWWLHVDLDVLATGQLAAVDYPQPGGLNWEELTELTAIALRRPGCTGWSITIYNPDLDKDGHEAARIVRYVEEVLSAVAHTQNATAP
ncbi:arginase family protein [Streptosporangium sp. NPDC000396]|uniref:arginase family protein n=1 Tax=Streptosporangium sp. NPDC000396 TaxID=3366185 RepID=UPI0036A3C8FE